MKQTPVVTTEEEAYDVLIVPTRDQSKTAKLQMLMDNPHIRVLTILSDNPEDVRVAIEAGFVQDTETREVWVRY